MHLLPFLLRAEAVLRRHISAVLAGKSHRTLLRGWPGSTGYQIFVISSQSPPPPPTLICHYLLLFVTIRDYSPLFALFVLFVTIRYSVFATIRYSLFGFSRHPQAWWWCWEGYINFFFNTGRYQHAYHPHSFNRFASFFFKQLFVFFEGNKGITNIIFYSPSLRFRGTL